MEAEWKESVETTDMFANNYENVAFWLDLKSHLTQVNPILGLTQASMARCEWLVGTLRYQESSGTGAPQEDGPRYKARRLLAHSEPPLASCITLGKVPRLGRLHCGHRWPGSKRNQRLMADWLFLVRDIANEIKISRTSCEASHSTSQIYCLHFFFFFFKETWMKSRGVCEFSHTKHGPPPTAFKPASAFRENCP